MSIVLDASAAVELVLGRPELTVILRGEQLHVPSHFDVEVTSALRGLAARGTVDLPTADRARSDLAQLSLTRHAPHLLVDRAWELRSTMSVHDGVYVALAQALACPLVTTDNRLGRAAESLVEVRPTPA